MAEHDVRHLVMSLDAVELAAGRVNIGCATASDPIRYDPAQHTYLTRLATCPDCLVVHAAWHVVYVAAQ